MADIAKLTVELTTDPLVRGYSGMTDEEVATDINLVNRPDIVTIEQVLQFLMLDNSYQTGDGDDTQDRTIWQRMKEVAALPIPTTGAVANPWGSTSIGNITEIRILKTHELVDYFTLFGQGNLPIDLSDVTFQVLVNGAENGGCMSTAQKTALLGLGDNLQSRAQELAIGFVRESDVVAARA